MKTRQDVTTILFLIFLYTFLHAEMRAPHRMQFALESGLLTSKHIGDVARVYLGYMVEHEGVPPESLFDLAELLPPDFPTQVLSYIQSVRQDEPVIDDALAATTPMLVDRHSLLGRVAVAYWDGHVEVMPHRAFAELVDKHGLVLSDQRQVALECRFLIVDSQLDEYIGIDLADPNLPSGHVLSGPVNNSVVRTLLGTQPPVYSDIPLQKNQNEMTLDDLQAGFLGRAAQRHRDTRMLTAPKAVVLNRERAVLEVKTAITYTDTDGQMKQFNERLCVAIQPFIEEDHSIRLKGYFQLVDVTGEETQFVDGREFSIPVVEITEGQFHRMVSNEATVLLGSGLITTQTDSDGPHVRRLLFMFKPTIVDEQAQADQTVRLPQSAGGMMGGFGGITSDVSSAQEVIYPRNWDEIAARRGGAFPLDPSAEEPSGTAFRTVVYDIGDLLSESGSQSDEVIKQEIIKTCDPSSWHDHGGQCRITLFGGVKLLIWQTPQIHERIKNHLKQKREALGV